MSYIVVRFGKLNKSLELHQSEIMKNDYLRIIWYKKLSKYSDNTALINGTFDELLKNYNSGKRYYHDLTHVIDLLKLMEQVNFQMNDEEVLYFTI